MVILENLYPGITLEWLAALFQWISAFAVQATDTLGGTRGVALLAIAGFIIGLLACMCEIKMIEIER